MEILCKYISATVAGLCAMLCPIAPLIATALVFIAIDFVTGIMASRAVARREGREWWIESRKAWRTIYKAGFTAVAIIMMWLIDHVLLGFLNLNLANLFTGFVCGVELWSFLENATTISSSPLFSWLGKWVKRRVTKEVDNE
ncbi:MAG: phage holin family protein [Alistipes sp.]|nr:phage holin family protein [Alistipes sp.]